VKVMCGLLTNTKISGEELLNLYTINHMQNWDVGNVFLLSKFTV